MCVCVCVCVCVHPFTVKASSVLVIWNAREQNNDIAMKTFLFYAKSLHRYFRMKQLTFLTIDVVLLTHLKQEEPVCDSLS